MFTAKNPTMSSTPWITEGRELLDFLTSCTCYLCPQVYHLILTFETRSVAPQWEIVRESANGFLDSELSQSVCSWKSKKNLLFYKTSRRKTAYCSLFVIKQVLFWHNSISPTFCWPFSNLFISPHVAQMQFTLTSKVTSGREKHQWWKIHLVCFPWLFPLYCYSTAFRRNFLVHCIYFTVIVTCYFAIPNLFGSWPLTEDII